MNIRANPVARQENKYGKVRNLMPEIAHGEQRLDLSIVLPAYNEEPAIAKVISEIREAMHKWDGTWEILVIDDASTDGTGQLAEQHGARVIRFVENRGAGAGRIEGTLRARGTLIAMLDADGTYDASYLPELLSFFPEYDQVNGARTCEKGDWKMLRCPAKWLIRKLAECISGKRIPDLNTGMKVFKREMMLRYLWTLPPGFSCVSSMTLAFLCNNHPVKYVPVPYRARMGKSKFHPVRDTAIYLLTVLRMIMYFQPLRVFLPLALIVGALAMARGCYNLAYSPLGLHDSDVILAMTALLIFVAGLLADLIVRQGQVPS